MRLLALLAPVAALLLDEKSLEAGVGAGCPSSGENPCFFFE